MTPGKPVCQFLILHRLREPPADGRIDSIGLRQRPFTPLFDLLPRIGSVTGEHQFDCLDVLPYFPSLLERCGIPQEGPMERFLFRWLSGRRSGLLTLVFMKFRGAAGPGMTTLNPQFMLVAHVPGLAIPLHI
ncbi:MAG TPA: hypothetical protein VMU26_27615 [Candidatus Polarisedimenticolia bacterium]|nr:hypothetical protein [Candidatus Polarisedimenticolia bacterium]